MTAKRFYNILAILLGYGLIIGGFLVFGDSLEDKVKILDIIVSCLIFTQFVQFSLFPLINFGDSSHKEVGMMGIHIYVLNFCCIVSIGIMIYGIIYHIPFKFQLFLGTIQKRGKKGIVFFSFENHKVVFSEDIDAIIDYKLTSKWNNNLAQPTNPVECVQSLTQKHVAKRYMIGEKVLPLRHES